MRWHKLQDTGELVRIDDGKRSLSNGLQWDFLRRRRYLLYRGLAGSKIVNFLAGTSFGYRQPLQFHNSQSVGRGAGTWSELVVKLERTGCHRFLKVDVP